MAYVIKGAEFQEMWQINQLYKNKFLRLNRHLSFLDINLNFQKFPNVILYEFDIQSLQTYKSYVDLQLNFEFLDIVFVYGGIGQFSSIFTKERVLLGQNEWAILSSKMAKRLLYEQEFNTHTKVMHILITEEALKKFIEFDCEVSQICEDAIFGRLKQDIILSGKAGVKIQMLFNSLHEYKSKSDKMSKHIFSLKVEELILLLLNSKNHQNIDIAQKTHNIILDKYSDNLTLKKLSKILNVSENTIRNKFKEKYGKTPNSVIFETKMLQAKIYKEKNPNTTISDLTNYVGYTNPHRFKKDFEKFFGINK